MSELDKEKCHHCQCKSPAPVGKKDFYFLVVCVIVAIGSKIILHYMKLPMPMFAVLLSAMILATGIGALRLSHVIRDWDIK